MRHFIATLIAIVAVSGHPAIAQDVVVAEPLTIGTTYTLSTHGVERHINVVTPQGYDEADTAFPLVVVLDGGLQQDFFLTLGMERWNRLWQRSAPAIFVGIETIDRQRELLPPTSDEAEAEAYPTAGESDAFRNWLQGTVLPLIRGRYRTDGRAFLIGESAAGHFVVETWVDHPAMFDGYAALSPSLQWSDQALSRRFADGPVAGRPPLFISLADEGGATEEGIMRLAGRSSSCFADRRDRLVHANTLHGLFPEALQFLLPTEANWLDEYGLTLDCSTDGGTLER